MNWQEVSAAVTAFLAWLGPWLERASIFYFGWNAKQAADRHKALLDLEAAARAAADIDALPDDDVMLQLEQRRLHRLPGK